MEPKKSGKNRDHPKITPIDDNFSPIENRVDPALHYHAIVAMFYCARQIYEFRVRRKSFSDRRVDSGESGKSWARDSFFPRGLRIGFWA